MKALLALSLAFALPMAVAVAQDTAPPPLPGKADTARITAGTYALDKTHTQINLQVNHFGFNDYFGLFGDVTGTLTIDPAKPTEAKVAVEIPIDLVSTSSAKLNEHLKGADFFNTVQFPTAKFVSTSVTIAENGRAEVRGDLTMLGMTKPVILETRFVGAGKNPFNEKATIGFHAVTTIKRSEWGMTKYVPFVGDDVKLRISAAFEK